MLDGCLSTEIFAPLLSHVIIWHAEGIIVLKSPPQLPGGKVSGAAKSRDDQNPREI